MISKHFYILAGQVYFREGNKKRFGRIDTLEDGYYRWWPMDSSEGCVDARHLIELGELINALNESWDTQVQNDPVISDPEWARAQHGG